MATIKPRRGTTAPTTGTITQHELAVDTTNKRIYIGAADGSGTLIGAAPAGSDTQVQFNDGGNLGGDAGLTYNKTTDTLTVTGDVAVNGGDLTTSSATASLFDATATTLNIGGAGTSISIGASTGSTTFNHGVVLSDKTLSRVELLDYFERAVFTSISKVGVLTLDLSSGQVFIVSLQGNVTSITINNIPDNALTSNSVGFTIIFTADGTARTITWPASVKWPGGTAPTMTSTNNKKDIISFLSDDAGTTWYGFVGGQNF
jgi:hypothetical protein